MAVMPSGGRYSFNFAEVATGNYQLMAGSDLDNDGMICEPGEACGAYPTMDSQQTVSVNGSVSGINFATGFHTAPGGMPAQPVTVGQSPN